MIADAILKEMNKRLQFLIDVGLEYLTLARNAGSLSGGEAQRIRLATQIGSGLTGVLYILDEPSIGLHQRDNARLIATLKKLRDLGNTLIVVEHDEDTMYAADQIIDIGPGAGVHGGEIVASGTPEQVMKIKESLTGQYLAGTLSMEVPKERRSGNGNFIKLSGVTEHNLKDVSIEIPLGKFTCITGVSGSGKSTLISDVLFPAISNQVMRSKHPVGAYKNLEGIENIDKVINIDQSPIGRTPRSNPATYVGVFDDIRELYTKRLPDAYGYDPTTQIQILCPSKMGDTGTQNLNKMLQDAVNPSSPDKNEYNTGYRVFRTGDKVMQTKNNYNIHWESKDDEGDGIFNGDIGFIELIDMRNDAIVIDFAGKRATYSKEQLQEIELAYAVTVHKSQGCEFEAVIMPIIGGFEKLYYRNLLYTAVTRAKKMVIMVGRADIVSKMVKNNSEIQRYTTLKHRILAEN